MKRLCLIFVACIIFAVCHGFGSEILQRAESAEAGRWADSVYNALNERERVAQLLFPKVHLSEGKPTIDDFVGENAVGGLLFSKGTLAEYAEMTAYARTVAKVPLLMTFDGEWGLAMRIEDSPRYPANMGLGAIRNPELLYKYGREVGRQMKLIGHHVDFAPVVDVNSNPDNPVIGYRSFGEDPAHVAALAIAMAKGLEDSGIQAVAKHFPGHGDTSTDSHEEKTIVAHDLATLEAVDMMPFRAFVDSGLSGVMVGHLIVPALDESMRPASLSTKMSSDILRNQLGFKGLVYTDGLGMKGAHLPGLRPEVEALKAGADVLLSPGDPSVASDAIMAEIEAGNISWETIEDRCKRILRFKYALDLANEPEIDAESLSAKINSPEAQLVGDELAKAAITVLRNRNDILPIGNLAKKRIAIVNVGAEKANDFTNLCRKYAEVDVFSTGNSTISPETLDLIRNHDVVIAAVYEDSAYCLDTYSRLKDMPGLVGVFMMNPYKMDRFSALLADTEAIVLAYENLPSLQRAAAMAVFGGIDVGGRLPVNLPGFPIGSGVDLAKTRLGYSSPLSEGMSAELPDSIDALVNSALASGAMPGCQVLVARNGNIVFEKAYGFTTEGGPTVDDFTLYDLASVSKVVGTLPGIMKLCDLGKIDLDAPAADYIPGLKEAGKTFTPRQMLYHETGMPAAINAFSLMLDPASGEIRKDITSPDSTAAFPWEAAKGIWVGPATADTVMNCIYRQPLRPTTDYNYSCLNFCLLLDMEQRITGQPHDKWVADSIFSPLGLNNTFYRPSLHASLDRIAPTENDSVLRRQLVHGYVHDETAAMQGGVSGNAGLFANAGDIAKLCQAWLQGGTYGGATILSPKTVELFMTSKSPTCRRGLGFDKPDPNPELSPTCPEASLSVVGHTGFTGTIFWIDPDEQLIYVFLTNRVNPSRINPAFARSGIRSKLFSQIYKSLHPAVNR